MLSLLLVPLALAGKKWEGAPTDIQAERIVLGTRQAIFDYLVDLEHMRALFPADCVGLWIPGERSVGEGANALVRYDMGAMHRKLAVTLVRADAPRLIDLDHVGPSGFVTRWSFAESDTGTRVSVLTPLNSPPWPLRGYYHKVVRPEWADCYSRTLDALAAVFEKG